ncbi:MULTISPECIES: hypothetical protein [Bacillati]|uniref:hypothetical protein n=1 Tax=Bacillati TaxID=1783272 RepID=UPI001312855A
MPLQINNMTLSRHASPPHALVHLYDEDNCAVIVKVELGAKSIEQYTLEEITDLAKQAAKHLVSST